MDQAEDLKKMIEDASKMLKTMIASNAGAAQSSSTSAVPTYESIQKQLDELKLKAMKVEKRTAQEDNEVGVLLDSGSTHVLRPARSEAERDGCKEVSVTLAGDEKRTLHQTPAGSIIVGQQGEDEAQTIIPFGKLIEVLNCTVKWTRSGLFLKHPAHGRIKTRLKGGCPEITAAGQAAKIISELEMKRVEELEARTASLRDQLNAIRMMEVRDSDWRVLLARYVVQGKAVDGLQALYKSSIFSELPDKVRMSLVPEVDLGDKSGWENLKALPMPRRTRKRLHKSDVWIVNLFGGSSKKGDPIQTLSGATSSKVSGEAVVINVDVLLGDEWNLAGEVYKAILWGAMKGKIKAVVGNPPCKTLAKDENVYDDNLQRYKKERELELLAKQFFLYLASYAAKEDVEPAFVFGAPTAFQGLWNHGMVREFEDVVRSMGVARIQFEQGDLAHPLRAPTTVLQNVNLDDMDGLKDNRPEMIKQAEAAASEARWCAGFRRAIVDGIKANGIGDGRDRSTSSESLELKKLTKEQGWKLHVQRDHVWYRKDCEQCVMSMGVGRPHRRTKQKSAYVLSVDVGGPLRATSRDAHGYGYNTFLLPRTRSLSSLDNHHLKNHLPKKSHLWTMTSRTWIWTRLPKRAGHRGVMKSPRVESGMWFGMRKPLRNQQMMKVILWQ